MLTTHLPTTRALQCFLAVAQELNFRSAAQLLHMSQPPLSRQIQALEDLLQVRLIHRDTRTVSLTPAGAAFRQEARQVLAALDAATRDVTARFQDQQPHAATVRVGFTSVIHYQAIPQLNAVVAAIAGPRPVVRGMSKQLVEQVRQGALDLAIVGDIAPPADGLHGAWLAGETMMVMLPDRHPAAGQAVVDLSALGETPLFWFARRDNPAFYDKCARVFAAHGYDAPRRPEPRDFTMLLAAVAAGDGLALCPQSMQAMSREGVVYRALPAGLAAALAIDLQAVWRAGDTRPAVLDGVARLRANATR